METGLLILGMHRSGTSAFAGALPLLGVELGSPLMPGRADENPKGYFEHLGVFEQHRGLLADLGRTWDDLRPLPPGWTSRPAARRRRRALAELVREELAKAPLWAVKDPRLCRLAPLWLELLEESGVSPRFAIVYREPAEVASSLACRDGFSAEKAGWLWASHLLAAELHSRGHRRTLVDYAALLADPVATLTAVGRRLGIAWPREPREAAAALDRFLEPSLRHHRGDDGGVEPAWGRVSDVVAGLREILAAGGATRLDDHRDGLDRLRGELDALLTEMDPLLLEHLAPAARRSADRDELEELAEHTRRLERRQGEVGRLTEALAEELRDLQQGLGELARDIRKGERLAERMEEWDRRIHRHGEEITALRDDLRGRVRRLEEGEGEARRSQERAQEEAADRVGRLEERLAGLSAAVEEQGLWRRHVDRLLEHLSSLVDDSRQRVAMWWTSKPWRLYSLLGTTLRRLLSGRRGGEGWLERRRRRAAEARSLATRLERSEVAFPRIAEPDVSIVIAAHGRAEVTARCLESIAAAEVEASFEVILVDDASPDVTAEAVAGVPGLRLVRLRRNLGFLRASNRGGREARGRHVLLLNNDTEVTDGWLDALVGSFASFPDAGMVGARLLYPGGTLQEAGCIVWRDGTAWNWGRGGDPDAPEVSYARRVDYCSAACVVLPRPLYAELGGFDRLLEPAYYEDVDLAFRVRRAGHEVYYQPAARVIHHEGASHGTDASGGVKRHQEINRRRFVERWQEALREHPENGVEPELAKDRGVERRALVLDHRVPTPDRDAGSRRLVHLLAILRRLGFKVTFLPDNLARREPYTADLQAVGVEALHHPWVEDVEAHLEAAGGLYDLVLASRLQVAERHLEAVRRHCPAALVVFDTVDLHHLRRARRAALEGDPELALAAAETRRRELAVAAAADATVVASPAERDLLASEAPHLDVHVISTIHPVNGCGAGYEDRRDLMFIGGFEHPPNVDAVLWLCDEILPRVHRELPDLHLHVIGGDAPLEVRARAGERVSLSGWVPDVEPWLRRCRLSVAPLRFGAGIKGKVTQSLSHGLPCVLTPIAAEGIGLADGEDALIADDADGLAAAIVRANGDRELWERLSAGGLRIAERRFSLDAAHAAVAGLVDRLGERRVRRPIPTPPEVP